ncbi:MAG TPA: hypothetical protein VLU46_12030 [Thermoanaerobaculia bacterium]|nr:hypothetical protein [Thermoanaerobaculia bacterium]
MTAQFGRLLQLFALLLLPIGLGMGLFRNNIAIEVRLLSIGGALFIIGWLLSKRGD